MPYPDRTAAFRLPEGSGGLLCPVPATNTPLGRGQLQNRSADQARLFEKAAHGGLDIPEGCVRYRRTRNKNEAAAGSYLRQERSYSLSQSAFYAISDDGAAYPPADCEPDLLIGLPA